MSRETKVGLIVAASFLLLVGSVVFYKVYMVPPPVDDTSADEGTQAEGPPKKPAPGKPPEKPATTGANSIAANAKPGSNDPPHEGRVEGSPPPPEAPTLTNNKDDRPPQLPAKDEQAPSFSGRPGTSPERPGDPPAPEKPGLSVAGNTGPAMRPAARPGSEAPPAGRDVPPPPETPENLKDARPAPAETRPVGEMKDPPPAGALVGSGRGSRSDFEEKKPVSPPPDVPPPEAPVTKEAPREDGRSGFENRPMPAGALLNDAKTGAPDPPLSLPPEARTPPNTRGNDTPPPPESPAPGARPPSGDLPPANAFDRRYDPPAAMGKPMTDPPATAEDSKRGIPVEIRPQPEIDNSPAPTGVRGSGNVVVFDESRYPVRAGDTYASISKLKYGSERFAEALALYNRERDPRMTLPQPGQFVVVPPAEILEKRYRTAVTSGNAAPPAATPVGKPEARGDSPVAFNPGENRPAAPGGGVSPRPSFNANAKEKTYRVRTGDTLWNIAKQTLGNGERWSEILRMNRDVLPEINRLQDGLILRLPADAKVDMAGTSP